MAKLEPGWYPNPEQGKTMYWDGGAWLQIPHPELKPESRVTEPGSTDVDYKKLSNLALIALVADFFIPPLGWYLGVQAKRQIKDSAGRESGMGLAKFSIWVGGFGTIAIPLLIALFMFGGGLSAQSDTTNQNSTSAASTSEDCLVVPAGTSCINVYPDGSQAMFPKNPVAGDTAEPEYSKYWNLGYAYAKSISYKFDADVNLNLLYDLTSNVYGGTSDASSTNNDKIRYIEKYFDSLGYDTYGSSCTKITMAAPFIFNGSVTQNSVAQSGCWAGLGYPLTKSPPWVW